uniref:Uncharacterized protein n=1 Tax=Anopheles atroparvus TaxID=41427 RepID=A0A182ILP9_ANOAO
LNASIMIRMLRLNLVLWIGCCCCLLLQAPWVVEAGHEPPPNSNRPTQLEDIERDNLNSERQVYKKEAIAQQQQQQQQHGASSSQSNNHYSVQIQHHPGSTAGTHSAVKYVTPLPAPTQALAYQKDHTGSQQYVSIQPQPLHQFHQYQQQNQQHQQLQHYHQQSQPVPQVHEDHSTYTVPSRQSLLQPVIGGSAPANPYLTPQPQYVYVQARPQQLPQYATDNNLPQSLLHILPQNSQAYIMIPSPYYQQPPPHPPTSPGPTSPTPSSTSAPHSAAQHAAYVNDPDNHIETYSHGETGAQAPSSTGPSAPQQATPQPDIVYAPSSTPAPARHQSPSAEFSIVKSIEQPVYYSHDFSTGKLSQPVDHLPQPPQHLAFGASPQTLHQHHRQHPPTLHHQPVFQHHLHHHPQQHQQQHYPAYFQTQGHSYAPQLYPSLAHPNTGILNYYGVQQRLPTSLLDSYVPSQLQLHKPAAPLYPTTKLAPHQPLHHHRPVAPVAGPGPVSFYHHQPGLPVYPLNPLHTTVLQPAGLGSQHTSATAPLFGGAPTGLATAPGYNTIAYSVPLAFTKTSAQYKRSPGLFSVAGFPRLAAPAAHLAATTKLQPAKPHP